MQKKNNRVCAACECCSGQVITVPLGSSNETTVQQTLRQVRYKSCSWDISSFPAAEAKKWQVGHMRGKGGGEGVEGAQMHVHIHIGRKLQSTSEHLTFKLLSLTFPSYTSVAENLTACGHRVISKHEPHIQCWQDLYYDINNMMRCCM